MPEAEAADQSSANADGLVTGHFELRAVAPGRNVAFSDRPAQFAKGRDVVSEHIGATERAVYECSLQSAPIIPSPMPLTFSELLSAHDAD